MKPVLFDLRWRLKLNPYVANYHRHYSIFGPIFAMTSGSLLLQPSKL